MARRILKETCPDGKVPVKKLTEQKYYLTEEHAELMKEYKSLKAEAGKAYSIKKAVEADYQKALGQDEINKAKRRKDQIR